MYLSLHHEPTVDGEIACSVAAAFIHSFDLCFCSRFRRWRLELVGPCDGHHVIMVPADHIDVGNDGNDGGDGDDSDDCDGPCRM